MFQLKVNPTQIALKQKKKETHMTIWINNSNICIVRNLYLRTFTIHSYISKYDLFFIAGENRF